jgi:hypothetical protein
MIHKKQFVMGMEMEVWKHKSCSAEFGEGPGWATLYLIRSTEPGKGHASELLRFVKQFYEEKGLSFGGTVALNERMRKIYNRLGIKEFSVRAREGKDGKN